MPLRTHRVLLGLVASAAAVSLTALGGAGPAHGDDTKPPLTNSSGPTVVGTGWSEDGLSVEFGTWSSEPDDVSTSWYRDDGKMLAICSHVCDLRMSDDEIGHTVTVHLSATADCCTIYRGTAESVTISGPVPLLGPTMHGPRALALGGRLRADPGSWTFPIDHYDYQWFRTDAYGHVLSDLTRARHYRTQPRDLGRCLVLKVDAHGSDGHEGSATSDPACWVTTDPRLSLHLSNVRSDSTAIARAFFDHRRRTVDRGGRIIVYVDGHRRVSRAVTSARSVARFAMPPGHHEIVVYARSAHHTGQNSRTFEVRDGHLVRRG